MGRPGLFHGPQHSDFHFFGKMPRIGLGAVMVHCSWICVCARLCYCLCIVGGIEEVLGEVRADCNYLLYSGKHE